MFPIQRENGAKVHPLKIPWSLAEKAYSVYSAEYGTSQSLARLAERGGFGPSEMDTFVPGWREEASEISELRAALTAADTARQALEVERDAEKARADANFQSYVRTRDGNSEQINKLRGSNEDLRTAVDVACAGSAAWKERADAAEVARQALEGERNATLLQRQEIRDALACCFGESQWDKQTWQIVAQAFDAAWPEER